MTTRRRAWRAALGAYLALVCASQLVVATRTSEPPRVAHGGRRVQLGSAPRELSALRWSPSASGLGASIPGESGTGESGTGESGTGDGGSAESGPGERRPGARLARLPVLLLHGSPGDATNLAALGERLARSDRDVLSLDLPGFGASAGAPGGRSIRAHAEAALECAPWPVFHVLGWSMGGGVGLHMTELGGERVRSLALVASIGVQEAEGSGSYAFEHVKYAANAALMMGLAELVPHFGFLPSRAERAGYARNFWESDQRPLGRLITELETPLLVAHGRRDFLVPSWCAERTHELAPRSRLVVLEAGHFLPLPPPFGELDRLAPELEAFLARHDRPGVEEARARVELDPPRDDPRPEPFLLPRLVPWWASFGAAALATAITGAWSGFALGGLTALLQVDAGLALIAGALGMLVPAWRRRAARTGRFAPVLAWGRGAVRFLGAFLAAAAFTAATAEFFCRELGTTAGALLASGLPIALAFLGAQIVRGWTRRRAARSAVLARPSTDAT